VVLLEASVQEGGRGKAEFLTYSQPKIDFIDCFYVCFGVQCIVELEGGFQGFCVGLGMASLDAFSLSPAEGEYGLHTSRDLRNWTVERVF
jgi:hypothetical protein